MYPLHISARDLLKTYGDDFCTEKQFVNYLSDCSIFEPVALKTIMKTIINEGYAKGLVDAKNNNENWRVFVETSIPKIVNRNGFEDTYVNYCFQCLCFGLQLIDQVDENMLKKNLSGNWTDTETTTADNKNKNKRTKNSIPPQQQNLTQQTPQFQQPRYSSQQNTYGIFTDIANGINGVFAPKIPSQNKPFTKGVKMRLIFICTFILLLIIIAFVSIFISTYKSFHRSHTRPSYYYPSTMNYEVTEENQENDLYNENKNKDDISDSTIEIPEIPEIPDIPDIPDVKDIPDLPELPELPELPDLDEPSHNRSQSPHYNSSQLQRKAKEYYQKAKERVMENLNIDEDEMKEKLNEAQEEVKEKWREAQESLMEQWNELRNR